MPFPENLDFDIVAATTLSEIGNAVRDWRGGRPRDEVAFMNHVTAKLSRRRNSCDVGVTQPVTMKSQLSVLHRQGQNQVDKFGSDLAVTISVQGNGADYIKTALFQFKKSEMYQLSLERKQLEDSRLDPRTEFRSFVLAVDEERSGIRINSVKNILADFNSHQASKSFDCSSWSCLTQWIWNWFSCEIGPISDPNDRESIEALLQQFVIEDNWDSPWPEGTPDYNIADDFLFAKAWLAFFFIGKETVVR